MSESDRDSGKCECSSLKSIMQTLDLIWCFQCVIHTLRGIWGSMYGDVCETGGTREVLPPRSLKRFTFKVCFNLKIDLRKQLLAPHHHWLSTASMRCTSRRCGSAQQCCNFFHVVIHQLHSIWGRIGWGHSMRTSHSAFSGSMGSTFRRESSCRDST